MLKVKEITTFCYCKAFSTLYVNIAAAFIVDLPEIASKYKLLKNFILNSKVLSRLIINFSKTFQNTKAKQSSNMN